MYYESHVPLAHMIKTVENYIYIKKQVQVKIKEPANDKELQMLGLAFDIANSYFASINPFL